MKQRKSDKVWRVLVVDDEQAVRESLELILEDHYAVDTVADGQTALKRIQDTPLDLVLLDINMPLLNGIEVLRQIKEYDQTIDVIMVSAADRAREATAAMKSGAYDYITKPFETEKILSTVHKALEKKSLTLEQRRLHSESSLRFGKTEIVSQAKNMHKVFELIEKVAGTSSGILITGESGTGKELVARAIHVKSPRGPKPFVAINCAAIPQELMESALFGHEKGAFTGAYTGAVGKFEFANGGTVFLDEVSSINLATQAKLLRVLQEREFTRVGGHQNVKVDVRLIAATNMRLEEMVKNKEFRSDLYFRLNVIPILLPPLRERKGDVALLADYFTAHYNRALKKNIKGLTPAAMEVLEAYPWPGNVRELENMMERLMVLSRDDQWIEQEDLPFDLLLGETTDSMPVGHTRPDAGLIQARQLFEKEYIARALQCCGWNQTDAARLLKIHRNTLIQKMKAYDLRPNPGD